MRDRSFHTFKLHVDSELEDRGPVRQDSLFSSRPTLGKKRPFSDYHTPENTSMHTHRSHQGGGSKMEVFNDIPVRSPLQQKYILSLKMENNRLKRIIKERQELISKLNNISLRDYLTDLYNQRYLWKRIESELKRAQRYHESLIYMMVDIDRFKAVNDNFNHQFGDYVLKKVAGILQKPLRASDILARYGGDEFSILLPNTDYIGAHVISQKILDWTRRADIQYNNFKVDITVSIGVSSYPSDMVKDKWDLVHYADSALYEAKAKGRNQVCYYNELSKHTDTNFTSDSSYVGD
ncbi:MAG: GGDEF domain-containing protein [bacterium]